MQVWKVLHAARCKCRTDPKKSPKIGTIPQLCRAISSQLRHVSTIGKQLVNQQYLLYMSAQYGELRLTIAAEIFSWVWGTPGNSNGFCVLAALLHGTLVVGISQTAALNRGRHLYSAGRPSRWAFAHISGFDWTAITFADCKSAIGIQQRRLSKRDSRRHILDQFHCAIIMVALWNRADYYFFILLFVLLLFFLA